MSKKLEISDLVKVESSNIDMVGFNEDTTYVQFKNGTIYSYPETGKVEFDMLVNAKSVGSQFARSYRSKENFSKLEKDVELVAMESELSKAMKIVTAAIKNDPSYRITWQANIAMAFKDEYSTITAEHGIDVDDVETNMIHDIANKAADKFLKILCRDVR
jgi:hypothetical protein